MYQICLLYFPKMFKIIRFTCLRTKLLYLRGHYLGFFMFKHTPEPTSSISQTPLTSLSFTTASEAGKISHIQFEIC